METKTIDFCCAKTNPEERLINIYPSYSDAFGGGTLAKLLEPLFRLQNTQNRGHEKNSDSASRARYHKNCGDFQNDLGWDEQKSCGQWRDMYGCHLSMCQISCKELCAWRAQQLEKLILLQISELK